MKLHTDGNFYVVDTQLCHIVVLSPNGKHIRTISREGDGPGELRQPSELIFPGPDVVGVGMGFPAKLVTLQLDGTPIATHYPAGAPAEGNVAVIKLKSAIRIGEKRYLLHGFYFKTYHPGPNASKEARDLVRKHRLRSFPSVVEDE